MENKAGMIDNMILLKFAKFLKINKGLFSNCLNILHFQHLFNNITSNIYFTEIYVQKIVKDTMLYRNI